MPSCLMLQLLAACVAITGKKRLHMRLYALCCIIADVPTKNSRFSSYVHLCRYHRVCSSVVAGHKEATALELGFDKLSGTSHTN